MMKKEKRRNIRKEILELAIGETVSFPLSRIDYVLSCRTRLQVDGRRYSSKKGNDNTISITREKDNEE